MRLRPAASTRLQCSRIPTCDCNRTVSPGEEALTRLPLLSLLDESTTGRSGTARPTRLEVRCAGRGALLGICRTALETRDVIRGAPASRHAGPRCPHHALGARRLVLAAVAEAAARRWG